MVKFAKIAKQSNNKGMKASQETGSRRSVGLGGSGGSGGSGGAIGSGGSLRSRGFCWTIKSQNKL